MTPTCQASYLIPIAYQAWLQFLSKPESKMLSDVTGNKEAWMYFSHFYSLPSKGFVTGVVDFCRLLKGDATGVSALGEARPA